MTPIAALLGLMPTLFGSNEQPGVPAIPAEELDEFVERMESTPNILIHLAKLYPVAGKAGIKHNVPAARQILAMFRDTVKRLDRRIPAWRNLRGEDHATTPVATTEQYQIISEEHEKLISNISHWARANMLAVYNLTVIAAEYVTQGASPDPTEDAALPPGEEWRNPDAGPD